MYFHRQELQHKATPDKPDAVYARKLQEVLGGQYGEISVAMQYSFQAWNMHMPGKYREDRRRGAGQAPPGVNRAALRQVQDDRRGAGEPAPRRCERTRCEGRAAATPTRR